jgi:predicted nucleic acid-binding protein
VSGIKTILADTNFIIYLLEGRKETFNYLDHFIVLSVVTEIELLGVKNISERVYKERKRVLDDSLIFTFDEIIKSIAIDIKQKHVLKTPDAIIAATAIKHKLPLLTADKALRNISGLDVILLEI